MKVTIEQRTEAPRERADAFQATRWSMVAALQGDAPAAARKSLLELCRGYWYPIYAYIRGSGREPEQAFDLAHAFFGRLVDEIRREEPRGHGQFRSYLLDRLNRFLAEQPVAAPDDGAAAVPAPVDRASLEERHRREQHSGASPESAFQRGFALDVLAHSLRRLRQEAEDSGRSAMFEQLEPFLTREPTQAQYEQIGRALAMRPLALVMAVKRLRSRYRELVEVELADTVASSDDLDAERGALLAILGA